MIQLVTNVVALGMSFLCGVFVPQSMMGERVLRIAHFLPAYWYVRINNLLAGVSGGDDISTSYWQFLGIEFGFAVLLFISYFLVAKYARAKTD
jgi:ABC-2 type transport system permease protein